LVKEIPLLQGATMQRVLRQLIQQEARRLMRRELAALLNRLGVSNAA
jgi:hypothetical protein